MVQVTISGSSELQGLEANLIKSFIVNAESLIGIFDELVHGECGVVWLNVG
jgi:hypothetical protein